VYAEGIIETHHIAACFPASAQLAAGTPPDNGHTTRHTCAGEKSMSDSVIQGGTEFGDLPLRHLGGQDRK
jgi:hypothetical protein